MLVALWAISDTATEQLMSRFYEHLVSFVRNNGYSKVSEWVPFMLIGDDITFDFGSKGKFYLEKVIC